MRDLSKLREIFIDRNGSDSKYPYLYELIILIILTNNNINNFN